MARLDGCASGMPGTVHVEEKEVAPLSHTAVSVKYQASHWLGGSAGFAVMWLAAAGLENQKFKKATGLTEKEAETF